MRFCYLMYMPEEKTQDELAYRHFLARALAARACIVEMLMKVQSKIYTSWSTR